MSTIWIEVLGMVVVGIIVIKDWVENDGDVKGDVKECGGRGRQGGGEVIGVKFRAEFCHLAIF
jgi:hypothetical protein